MTNASDNIPVILDLDEMLEWLVDRGYVRDLTADEVEVAGSRVGRNAYPALVLGLYYEGLLTHPAAAHAVPSAWLDVEYPSRAIEADEWRDLFRLAGYTHNGVYAPRRRPRKPRILYRGAIPEHRAGWSWTEDRALAQWFADRFAALTPGHVYVAEVPPSHLLACISGDEHFGRTNEGQFVVDTEGLVIGRAAGINPDEVPGAI